ncbi:MAG: hypothetical protein ACLFPQ_02020 [Candidatus Woesearchaeota archaeon]
MPKTGGSIKMKQSFLISTAIIFIFVSINMTNADTRPPMPPDFLGEVTYYGALVEDGENVSAIYNNTNYASGLKTINGFYYLSFARIDDPITYNNDPDCQLHDPCRTCIPGYGPDHPGEEDEYCIEGLPAPDSGSPIILSIGGISVMPYAFYNDEYYGLMDVVSPIGDWERDGCVDTGDIPSFASHYDETCNDPGWDPIYDLNWDCVIDTADIPTFAEHYEEGCLE